MKPETPALPISDCETSASHWLGGGPAKVTLWEQYYFNAPIAGHFTAQHEYELPFIFNNIQGDLSDKALVQLATDMSSSWISFIAKLDPNAWGNESNASSVTPTW